MPWCTLANQPGYTDTPAMECSEHGLCQVARGYEFVFRNSHPHLIDLAMDQIMASQNIWVDQSLVESRSILDAEMGNKWACLKI